MHFRVALCGMDSVSNSMKSLHVNVGHAICLALNTRKSRDLLAAREVH
jgi:hypothetical protein